MCNCNSALTIVRLYICGGYDWQEMVMPYSPDAKGDSVQHCCYALDAAREELRKRSLPEVDEDIPF